jgi:type IV pilus assembly protein PilY1
MSRTVRSILILAGLLLALPGTLLAGTDEFAGDTSIYSGVPTTHSRPNVLIIVDNSRATLNTAPGAAYDPDPDTTYTGAYSAWNIYSIDNQGDVANLAVLTNTTSALENLTCAANSDVIRRTLQQRGTYSGSGSADFPNIDKTTGGCDTSPKGAVYVLGNYMNYTTSFMATPALPATVPAACSVANPVVKAHEWKNDAWTSHKFGYFRLKTTAGATHTSINNSAYTPYFATVGGVANPQLAYWEPLPTDPPPPTFTQWLPNTTYTRTLDLLVNVDGSTKTCASWIADAGVTPPSTAGQLTQREIMYNALEQALGSALGAVNFGAMVYGDNNSGGKIIYGMADLSVGAPDGTDAAGVVKPIAPDCSLLANVNLPFCRYLAALPGPPTAPGATTYLGAATLSSNTGRPQGESVFDAGYYFGATYTPVTNTERIAEAIANPCGLNHIILLTNGFTNGDGSPNLGVIGDADGDHYPDETVYGLGSHWLDDVAKYLKNFHGIKTHTVLAFQEEDTLIENAAFDGGGKYFHAYNAQELSAALLKLLASIINESNTSFVAPVVPASTTNRTISSNKVYLGLFRPQESEPWRGNVKKYTLGTTDQLLAADGTPATDAYGNFDRNSISYWSLRSDGLISSAAGDIDPASTDPNKAKGDGGQVDAGGAGGKLLKQTEILAAAVKAQDTWAPTGVTWRNIYTVLFPAPMSGVASVNLNLTNAQNLLATTNGNILPETLGVTTAAERDNLIRYIHGFTHNPLATTSEAAARAWVLGDVLHSRPLVFNYTKYGDAQENLCTADASGRYNSSIIYVGANDGMLHAFRDCDGSELWALILPESLTTIRNMKDPLSVGGHPTFVDAAPSAFVHDANGDGVIDPDNDKVVLLFGMRRGAGSNDPANTSVGAYYAIDVTTPTAPVALWWVDQGTAAEMAETWAQPRIAKLKVDDNNFKVVMFVGGGYDTNEDTRFGNTQTFLCDNSTPLASRPTPCVDTNTASSGGTVDGSGSPLTSLGSVAPDNRLSARGRGIYAIEVANMVRVDGSSPYVPTVTGGTVGSAYWGYTRADNVNMKYAFASDLTVLDVNSDGYADLIYAGDTGGNLWRFDLSNADKTAWNGEIMFRSNPGADSTNGRKFFYRPVTATAGGVPRIYIGTGDREHPLNRAVTDRIYNIIDWKVTNPSLVYPVDESTLEDVTLNLLQKTDTDPDVVDAIYKRLHSRPDYPYDLDGNFRYGWYIKLDGVDRNASGDPGEKVLASATVFNGQVFYSTYQLKTGLSAGCDAGNLGISRLYHLDYMTGEAVFNYDLSNDLNDTTPPPANERAVGGDNGELLQRTDRVRTLGEGIPSGIVTLIDASGNVTLLISSSDKVEASGLPDVKLITPVYWMQW